MSPEKGWAELSTGLKGKVALGCYCAHPGGPASAAEWSCASTGTHSCIQRRIYGQGCVPSWKSFLLALCPEIPAIAAGFGVAPSPSILPSMGWCSQLLPPQPSLPFQENRDLGSSCSDALNVYTPTFATPALSKKCSKFRFPPPPCKCRSSGQVPASHFLLERRIFWQFLDVVNKIMPHFG